MFIHTLADLNMMQTLLIQVGDVFVIFIIFIGTYFLNRDLALWCKNKISSRTFQTNIIAFTLLMLVDTFTLHMLLDTFTLHMLLDMHIVFILLSILYMHSHIWYV
jgi:hypothetical protein